MSIRIQRASSKRYLEFEAAGVLVRDGFELNESGAERQKWRLADETPELLQNADWLWFRDRLGKPNQSPYFTIDGE